MPKNGHPNQIHEIILIAIDFFAQSFKLFRGIKVMYRNVLCRLQRGRAVGRAVFIHGFSK